MCMHVCIYVCVVFKCECIHVYLCVRVFMRLVVCPAFQTHLVRSRTVTRDLDLCSLKTRYTENSKADPWDDPEIHTSSCSEDQTAIRIQNRVISCDCSLLCYFFIYCCQ